MTIESEYHSNFADARASAGDALGRLAANGHGQTGLFNRLDWFAALHTACLSDQSPLIAEARNGSGGQAWMALSRENRHIHSLAHWYSFTWQPIWTGLPSDASKDSLLHTMVSGLREHGCRLTLSPVPQENGTAAQLAAALRKAGWVVDSKATSRNHWLETDGRNFADWWADRPGALRSTVQRKAKKGLVALSITDQFSERDWDDYESVYQQSWKPAEGFPDFLRDWARSEGDAGTLRLGIARIDGVAVAAQFWSCDNGTAYIHKLAHVAGHDALSPGTLLTHALFAHAFDVDRVRRIDFGSGDDGYKRDWMEHSAGLMTIWAWNPKSPAAWPSLARHYLSRLAAWARGR